MKSSFSNRTVHRLTCRESQLGSRFTAWFFFKERVDRYRKLFFFYILKRCVKINCYKGRNQFRIKKIWKESAHHKANRALIRLLIALNFDMPISLNVFLCILFDRHSKWIVSPARFAAWDVFVQLSEKRSNNWKRPEFLMQTADSNLNPAHFWMISPII